MRDLKLKVWDKNAKIWLDDSITIPLGRIKEYAEYRHLEVVEYTGLFDKNGKEIWEGDILHIKTEDMVNMNYKIVVEWVGQGFYKEFMNYGKSEVIGNIYENKELLK